jgi:hypothetical protein
MAITWVKSVMKRRGRLVAVAEAVELQVAVAVAAELG